MTWTGHAALADALLPALLEAGRIELAYYIGTVEVEEKSDSSPVTVADREAEAVLVKALAAAAPGIPVVAEESVAAGSIPEIGGTFFLVDPLDGTREFIKKRDEFTINVGLIAAGRPTFGAVYAPVLGELYITLAPGEAVFAKVMPDSPARTFAELDCRPLATRAPDTSALVALGSRSHRSPATEEFLARYAIADMRAAGSSIKFCVIARGDADLYPRIGETSEWDTAAAQAVLEAAGGSVTTVDGKPMVYGKADRRFLNPHFVAWGRGPIPPKA